MTEPTEYGKRTRWLIIGANAATLVVIVASVLALVWWAPDTDLTSTAIGLFGTIAGMVVKNSSTIVDYVFGGSDKST